MRWIIKLKKMSNKGPISTFIRANHKCMTAEEMAKACGCSVYAVNRYLARIGALNRPERKSGKRGRPKGAKNKKQAASKNIDWDKVKLAYRRMTA
jgi:response regulator of citrate/malate metabolism